MGPVPAKPDSSATSTSHRSPPMVTTTAYPVARGPPCLRTLEHASVAASRMSEILSSSTPTVRRTSPSMRLVTGTLSASRWKAKQNFTCEGFPPRPFITVKFRCYTLLLHPGPAVIASAARFRPGAA